MPRANHLDPLGAFLDLLAADHRHGRRHRLLDQRALVLEVVPEHAVRGRILGQQPGHDRDARQHGGALLQRRLGHPQRGVAEQQALPVAVRAGPEWSTGTSCQRTSSGGRS
jgi:hypothetical protein